MGKQPRGLEVYLVYVDPKKCNACRECIKFCHVDVFDDMQTYAYPRRPENCLGCRTCEGVCEQRAVIVTEI